MREPVHFSRLKLMSQSPAHYAAARREESRALGFGATVHVLALGGDVVVYDGERKGLSWSGFKAVVAGAEPFIYDGPRTGKAWAIAKEDAGDAPILPADEAERAVAAREVQRSRLARGLYPAPIVTTTEHDLAARCAAAVRANRDARELLEGAQLEQRLSWSYLGRECAGTVDALAQDHLAELKTTRCSEPLRFTRDAVWRSYHAQLAWYRIGATPPFSRAPLDAYVIAVESKEPWVVTVFKVTDEALEQGEKLLRGWMERLIGCEAFDEWPGYVQSVVPLDVESEVELVGFDEEEAACAG